MALKRISLSFCLLGMAAVASCSVDTSEFEFDDEKFDSLGDSGTSGLGGMGGSAASEECTGLELRCNERQVETCHGDDWIDVGARCDFACGDGACTGGCEPNDTLCVSNTSIQSCNQSGEWESSHCEFACVDGRCNGTCKPGARRCGGADNLDRQRCNDSGTWVPEARCQQQCTGGACTGSCTEGDTQCVGGLDDPQRITCENGAWDPSKGALVSDCEYVCVNGECSGVCEPGDTRCAEGEPGAEGEPSTGRQTCNSLGIWGEVAPCTYLCTGEGNCTGNCRPGDVKCGGDERSELVVCDEAGQWSLQTDCSEQNLACINFGDEFACAECTPGSSRCTRDMPEICSEDGTWQPCNECGDQFCEL